MKTPMPCYKMLLFCVDLAWCDFFMSSLSSCLFARGTTSFRKIHLKTQSDSTRSSATRSSAPPSNRRKTCPIQSQQKDARRESQRWRRLRLGMRRGSCHGPRGVGGLLPPPRQIGLPPGPGRSVGRISRSHDLRVVRGNFQQVPIELLGCRPFREGCLPIRHFVFLCRCSDNVGKYKS